MRANPLIVEVVETTAGALPPSSRATNGQRAVLADGEAASVNRAGLRRAIELELVICYNGTCAAEAIAQHALVEVADESAVGSLVDVSTIGEVCEFTVSVPLSRSRACCCATEPRCLL